MLGFWILILLLLAWTFAMPWWPYSRSWGYWPGSVALVILALWLLILWLDGVTFVWPWA